MKGIVVCVRCGVRLTYTMRGRAKIYTVHRDAEACERVREVLEQTLAGVAGLEGNSGGAVEESRGNEGSKGEQMEEGGEN